MQSMKGARALASGMLVLAAICAAPAISAAQDTGTTTDATTTATTPAPPPPAPGDPEQTANDKGGKDEAGTDKPASAPGPVASATVTTSAPTTSAGGTGAHKSASASVTMGDLFFSPASVTVAVGDTVTWSNTGQAPHNATADDGSFKTPDLSHGESASHTFTSAGTFSYICTIHPQMKGAVRVLAASSGGGGSSGGGSAESSSSGSSNSEASAVASPDAAGDANTLPMTGMAAGALALVGIALIAAGVIARLAGHRWLSIF